MRRRGEQSGFALLLVFAMAASVAMMLYMQLPRAAFEAQRGKEEMLQDRGEQYIRAIQLYVAAWRSYPPNLDALEKTNNRRFLRRRYKDPMTGKDEWRAIHVNGVGQLVDSIVQKQGEGKKEAVATSVSELPTVGATTGTGTGEGAQNVALRRRPSDGGPAGGGGLDPQSLGYGAQVSGAGVTPGTGGQQQPPLDPQQQFQQQLQQQQQQQLQQQQQMVNGQMQPGQPGQPVQPVQNPGQPGQPNPYGMPMQPGQPQPGPQGPPNPYSQPGQPTTNGNPPFPQQNPYGQPGMPQQQQQQPPVPPQPGNPPVPYPTPAAPGGSGFAGSGSMPTSPGNQPGRPGGANAGLDMINKILTTPRGGMNMGIPGAQGMQVGGGIAGFASMHEAPSIKVYNERQKYNEWEFIYDMKKDKRLLGAAAGAMGNMQPQNPLGGPNSNNPLGGPNPGFGQSPTNQNTNPNPGQTTNPNSFGGQGGFNQPRPMPNYPQPGRR